jgi:hypothetical protein
MRRAFGLLLIAATISLSPAASRAEEQAAGHYFPGGISSYFDLVPANFLKYKSTSTPIYTLAIGNDSTYYHGSSNTLFGANATSYTDTWLFLCQFPRAISILPGEPHYSVALAVPYTWLRAHALVQHSKNKFIPTTDTDSGFGDVELLPIMLNWANLARYPAEPKDPKDVLFGYQWGYQAEFGIYAPTGNFESHGLPNSAAPANLGRNYWTFEPSAAAGYLIAPAKEELQNYLVGFTISPGIDFNTKNGATQYQTGDQFHLDGTLTGYYVLGGPKGGEQATQLVGLGASGFFYQQITRDSGSGAVNGSFKAMTTGVGPDLSYLYSSTDGYLTMGADVKWLPELSVSNRLQGNIIWLKLAIAWGTPKPQAPAAFAAEAAATPAAPVAPNVRALYAIPSL